MAPQAWDAESHLQHSDAGARRGLYRTSAAKWQVPKDLNAQDSTPDPATGGMCSPLIASRGQAGAATLTWSTNIPGRLAPVFLAFKLKHGRSLEGSRHGQHFAVPVGMGLGDPRTLGEQRTPVSTCQGCLEFDGHASDWQQQGHHMLRLA